MADVQLQMEADDETAYQTTYTTDSDDDGNEIQVAQQTYAGTTESLLDIIRDLRARVTQLEAQVNS